jgi:hypothetical protein
LFVGNITRTRVMAPRESASCLPAREYAKELKGTELKFVTAAADRRKRAAPKVL